MAINVRVEDFSRKSGTRGWRIRFRDPATNTWRRQVVEYATCRADAEQVAEEKRRQLLLLANFFEGSKPMRFAEVVDQFLSAKGKRHDTSEVSRARVLCRLLGDRYVDDLELEDLLRVKDTLEERPTSRGTLGSATMRQYIMQLQRVLAFARDQGWARRNIASALVAPRPPPPRNRVVTAREFMGLLNSCKNPVLRAAFVLARASGVRRSELFGMTAEMAKPGKLSVGERTYSVAVFHLKKTKNGTTRSVPVPLWILDELAGINFMDKWKTPISMGAAMWAQLQSIGADFVTHDFRGTTFMVRHLYNRWRWSLLMKAAGWTGGDMLLRYVKKDDLTVGRLSDYVTPYDHFETL